MPKSHLNFIGRFQAFLGQIESAERIDNLELTQTQKDSQKADYFFRDREIICEFKVFESDSRHKIEDVIRPHTLRDDWPIVVGAPRPLERILERLPDGEEIKRQIFLKVSDSVERNIRKANGQIRDTKTSFDLPNSTGLLVLVNETVHSLTPKTIVSRIGLALTKRTVDKKPQFDQISAILLIQPAHVLEGSGNKPIIGLFAIENALSRNQKLNDFVNCLMERWGVFEGITMEPRNWGNLDQPFVPAKWDL
ncbi:MAG: hypothetical protein ABI999_11495 [Acidobacteriota bacterium]